MKRYIIVESITREFHTHELQKKGSNVEYRYLESPNFHHPHPPTPALPYNQTICKSRGEGWTHLGKSAYNYQQAKTNKKAMSKGRGNKTGTTLTAWACTKIVSRVTLPIFDQTVARPPTQTSFMIDSYFFDSPSHTHTVHFAGFGGGSPAKLIKQHATRSA